MGRKTARPSRPLIHPPRPCGCGGAIAAAAVAVAGSGVGAKGAGFIRARECVVELFRRAGGQSLVRTVRQPAGPVERTRILAPPPAARALDPVH